MTHKEFDDLQKAYKRGTYMFIIIITFDVLLVAWFLS